MAHKAKTREAARSSYIYDNMPLTQIAAARKVSVATVRAWKKKALEEGDDWDRLRAASLIAGEGMEAVARQTLSEYVMQHKTVMAEIINDAGMAAKDKVQALGSLADSFNKMVAASRRILPESDELAIALRVIQMLTEFVRQKFPQHTRAILEIIEPFTEEVVAALGVK